jgi:hypothetical protein
MNHLVPSASTRTASASSDFHRSTGLTGAAYCAFNRLVAALKLQSKPDSQEVTSKIN